MKKSPCLLIEISKERHINGDDIVDIFDLVLVVGNFGKGEEK